MGEFKIISLTIGLNRVLIYDFGQFEISSFPSSFNELNQLKTLNIRNHLVIHIIWIFQKLF